MPNTMEKFHFNFVSVWIFPEFLLFILVSQDRVDPSCWIWMKTIVKQNSYNIRMSMAYRQLKKFVIWVNSLEHPPDDRRNAIKNCPFEC